MRTIAAVLRTSTGPFTLEDLELRGLRADELLVRIVGAGMCHTDVLPRSEGLASVLPLVAGHEGAGVVEAVGPAVTGVEVGDHVVLSFDSCGRCESCSLARPAHCDEFFPRNLWGPELDGSLTARDADGSGVSARWFGQSSFATRAITTARNTVVVDRSLPLELLGPLGCGIQTGAGSILVALDVRPDSSVAVFGSGAVGLAAVMAAKLVGARPIIAVDLHERRLELAAELGATHRIRGDDPALHEQVVAITGGGCHYSLDTTGVPGVITTALAATRLGGTCGLVGAQQGDVVLGPVALVGKALVGILEGSVDPQSFIPRLIALWRDGRFPFDRLIETFPLDQINEAERAALEGRVVKPVLLP